MHDGGGKIISILTLYRMRMQGYCDVYKWTILKRTSPEVKFLHLTSSRREMCTLSVSNMIYFIPSSESSAYLKQIKCILSAVKKYRIFSLVTDTIFTFSL